MLSDPNDPPNLRELSEKETLEVIELVRKEFKVDDDRTYVMGHSMGGAGALYLAIKYPQRWAAAVALAPAAFSVDKEGLARIPKMPVMLVHGDMDTVVPVTVGRAWAEAMKSVPMKDYQYIEVPGGDHGTVIGSHQAEVFAFFAKHSVTVMRLLVALIVAIPVVVGAQSPVPRYEVKRASGAADD